jgi:hypothetical protein
MSTLMLDAYYDSVNKGFGPTMVNLFTILLAVEFIYVMIKYVLQDEKK